MFDNDKVQDDLIDRYLRHQLSAAELADFEIRMLEHPRFFAEVQEAELMHQSFKKQESHTGTLAKISYLPFRLWIKQPMSLAASAVLGIGVLLVANLYTQRSGSDGLQGGYAVNSVINIGQTRGTADEITLVSGVHLLQVDVGISLSDALYRLSLRSEDSGQEYLFQVAPDGNGVIRVLTPARLHGRYELVVRQPDSGESMETYRIRFD